MNKKRELPKQIEGYIQLTKENLQENINNGLVYKELEQIYGIKENAIRKYIKRLGIIRPNKIQKKGFKELTKENLIEEYIVNNKRFEELKEIFGFSDKVFSKKIKEWNIVKDNELKKELRKKYCLKKYGKEFISQVDDIKKKQKETNLKKYGKESYFQTEEFKKRQIKVINEKYGYVKSNVSQLHLSRDIIEIINNKEKLEEFIIKNNITNGKELSEKLNVNTSGILRKIRKFNLDYLMDRSQSLEEKELKLIIEKYYKTENNTRKYLNGKEIDIFIPELNIGIEFNGNYWHCEKKVDKNYHQQKSLLGEEKGIFLYHIFEYEWIYKKEQIINQLNNLLGININKIYARKCVIKKVDNKEKKLFLEENHLQGNDSSSIKLGLYYNDELVSLMTFCKPRFNKKYEWELSRFCSKSGCNVIGGASKLFKYFIEKYKPQSIISYSNIAHTKGKLYETLGFKLKEISEPNYVWWKTNLKPLSRYQCQKHKLLQQGYIGNSETDIMHNRKYFKIYDCGNKVWEWMKMV